METILILGNDIRLKAQLEVDKALAIFSEFARQVSGDSVPETPRPTEMAVPQSLKKPKERGRVDKEELISLYIDENKTVRECADYFGVSIQGVTGFLSRHGIRKNSKDLQEKPKTSYSGIGAEQNAGVDTQIDI